MLNKKEMFESALASVKKMNVEEYNVLYNNISDSENINVSLDNFAVNITSGRMSYIAALSIDYSSLKKRFPAFVEDEGEKQYLVEPFKLVA